MHMVHDNKRQLDMQTVDEVKNSSRQNVIFSIRMHIVQIACEKYRRVKFFEDRGSSRQNVQLQL